MPTLAKCARCKELFLQEDQPVCPSCWPQEEAEYARVREALDFREGLTAPEVASVAQVTLDVVTRMLDGGRIGGNGTEEPPRCGCCGAPAISHSKRLCQACLIKLDQECAEAMRDLRKRMSGFATAGIHQVHAALSAKRKGRAGDRIERAFSEANAASTAPGTGGMRMGVVVPRNRAGRAERGSRQPAH